MNKIFSKVLLLVLCVFTVFSASTITVNASLNEQGFIEYQKTSSKKGKKTSKVKSSKAQSNAKKKAEEKKEVNNVKKYKDTINKLNSEYKNYDDFGETAVNGLYNIYEAIENDDQEQFAYQTLKTAIIIGASCFGFGDTANAIFNLIDSNVAQPQDPIIDLQNHLDSRLDEVIEDIEYTRNDIYLLSNSVDNSTEEIKNYIEDSLNVQTSREYVREFLYSSSSSFSYRQYKNMIVGLNDPLVNPIYYEQAYYSNLLDALYVYRYEDLDKYYVDFYTALNGINQFGASNNTEFYKYIIDEDGMLDVDMSVQQAYYEYLSGNREILESKGLNPEYEAIKLILDIYNTALFANTYEYDCLLYFMNEIKHEYGKDVTSESKFIFGNFEITYGEIKNKMSSFLSKQELLNNQIVADLAYVFNLEYSYVVKNNGNKIVGEKDTYDEIGYSDDKSFGNVSSGQTIYLNMLSNYWTEFFNVNQNNFEYKWTVYQAGTIDTIDDSNGYFYIDPNEKYDKIIGYVYYNNQVLYSIDFIVDNNEYFSGGDGTVDNPYIINTEEQFLLMIEEEENNQKNEIIYYVINKDLDFSNFELSPICNQDDKFNSVIDGRGHKLSNINIVDGEYASF